MSDIKKKIVDGNRAVIESSSDKRAAAKVDSQGAAYSQKDLVTVIKAIDTAVNKTKVEGVVTDSFFEMVGDQENHFIAVIHTGMVIKRQEEGLPLNPNAKQFSPDSLPVSLQQMLGYGYYPVTSKTKRQAETEESIARHINSGDIVMGNAANGLLSQLDFSPAVKEKFNQGVAPRISRSVLFAIQNGVYVADMSASSAKNGWVFQKKGFPKEISDCYIGFVASENSSQEQLMKGFVKADTKSKVDAKNKGFNILFGRKIVEATYHMRNPDGTPLIDPTNWFKENPIEKNEIESALFGENVVDSFKNKFGHEVKLVLSAGMVEVRANFSIPLVGRNVENVSKVVRIDQPTDSKLISMVVTPGFEPMQSKNEQLALNMFNGAKEVLGKTLTKEDAKGVAKIVSQKLEEAAKALGISVGIDKDFTPFSVRFIHFPSGAVNVVIGGGLGHSYPEYDPKHPTGAETALPAEFAPLYKMETIKDESPLGLETLESKVVAHFTGLMSLPQMDNAITVQILVSGKESSDTKKKSEGMADKNYEVELEAFLKMVAKYGYVTAEKVSFSHHEFATLTLENPSDAVYVEMVNAANGMSATITRDSNGTIMYFVMPVHKPRLRPKDMKEEDTPNFDTLRGLEGYLNKLESDTYRDLSAEAEKILAKAKSDGVIKDYTIGQVEITTGMKKQNPKIEDVLVKTDATISEHGGATRMSPFTMGRGETVKEASEAFIAAIQAVVDEAKARLDKNGVRRISSLDELE